MAMLGDLLASARSSASGIERWLQDSDRELADGAAAAAAAAGLGLAGYARLAVADFSRFASEEDWATLISSLRDSPDPGTTCLAAMVHWRLNVAACAMHAGHRHEGAADG